MDENASFGPVTANDFGVALHKQGRHLGAGRAVGQPLWLETRLRKKVI